jgi:lambda repressor-like predicted transcriptional regulator
MNGIISASAAAQKVEALALKTKAATEKRDYWIKQAHKEGSSLRNIGYATGLSHTAIAKILARG